MQKAVKRYSKTLYAHIRTSNILCVYLGLYHSFYHGNLAFIL